VLTTTLLIYAYARTFLTRFGAFVAAAAYPTMGQVLEIARFAETEGLFTLLVSASLLVWHWGYTCRWPATVTWTLGYGLAGLAGLAKGLQGPVYFVASSWCVLVWQRDWRYLVSFHHLVGVATLMIVIGSWQVPFYLRTDWPSTLAIWTEEILMRLSDNRPSIVLKHLVAYPFEVFVCMLPWSAALAALCRREVRAALGHRPHVAFLTICVVVTFPTVWFPTGANTRYFMPLYPIAAVLTGTVLECCWSGNSEPLRAAWSRFVIGIAGAAVTIALVLLIAGAVDHSTADMIAQPWWFAVAFLASAVCVAIALRDARQSRTLWTGRLAIFCIAAFMALLYTGAVVNALARVQADPAAEIAALKRTLPQPLHLVSLGPVNHRFRYFYGQPISLLPWPQAGQSSRETFDYFCVDGALLQRRPLPFAWEQLAVFSMHRSRTPVPSEVVVVGRRIVTVSSGS
jgi:4-amino-4-deoxy-L-arabinose transferase-like glycosyltransferase